MSMSPANALLSFSLIVLAPTSLWTLMIYGAAVLCDVTVPQVVITVIATSIGIFLTVIWTLLIASRPSPSIE